MSGMLARRELVMAGAVAFSRECSMRLRSSYLAIVFAVVASIAAGSQSARAELSNEISPSSLRTPSVT